MVPIYGAFSAESYCILSLPTLHRSRCAWTVTRTVSFYHILETFYGAAYFSVHRHTSSFVTNFIVPTRSLSSLKLWPFWFRCQVSITLRSIRRPVSFETISATFCLECLFCVVSRSPLARACSRKTFCVAEKWVRVFFSPTAGSFPFEPFALPLLSEVPISPKSLPVACAV